MSAYIRPVLASGSVAAAALAVTVLAAPAMASSHLTCGSVVTENTELTADLVCDGTTDALIVGADNIVIDLKGFTISGPGAYDATGSGIRIAGRQGVTVQKGTITGFRSAVVVDSGSGNTVTKIVATDSDQAINIANGADTTVSKNTVSGSGRDGIRVGGSGASGTVVTQNVLSANTWSISVSGADHVTVSRNTVTDSGTGITVFDGSVGAVVSQNTVSGTARNGIETSSTTSGSLISRNLSASNGGYGFAIDGSVLGDVTIVEKNTALGNAAGGFLLIGHTIDGGGNMSG